MEEPKNVKEALVEITGETRKSVEFRPCPDCGCDKYPYLIVSANGKSLHVKAECYRCGWRTVYHKSVKDCAKEWNEAEV